jgi:CubicO group peptidase (beta-lactamase class C family)
MTTTTPSVPSPGGPAAETTADDQLRADPALAAKHQAEDEIHGTCMDQFTRVRDVFVQQLTDGTDIGASLAVFVDGEPVIDLWGGYFDDSFTRPWSRHTITNGFSSTKTMTALCALLLADRGQLDLDAPVAEYWPEFAAAGKADVRVRYLLGHTSGVAGWTRHMTISDICELDRSTELLAQQEPWWEPGTAAGYHGFTQGHLVGEVIRRITGKRLGTFLAEEVTAPLGIEQDYYIGTPEEADPYVTRLIPGFPIQPRGNRFFDRAMLNPPATPRDTWTIPWRRAGMGALNGHGNARGLASAQSILASGGVRGVRMMSDAGRDRVHEQQAAGIDLVLDMPLRWGMGYSLNNEIVPASGGRTRVAWWAGNGGSMSFVDLDRRFSFGYVPNKWVSGGREMDRNLRLLNEVYRALGTD